MKVGDLFRHRNSISIHTYLDGCVGIILSGKNRYGQYKTQVGDKTLYLLRMHMEQL